MRKLILLLGLVSCGVYKTEYVANIEGKKVYYDTCATTELNWKKHKYLGKGTRYAIRDSILSDTTIYYFYKYKK